MRKEIIFKSFDALYKSLDIYQNRIIDLHKELVEQSIKEFQETKQMLRKLRARLEEVDWFCMTCGSFNTSSSYPVCEGCGLDVTLRVGDKAAGADK